MSTVWTSAPEDQQGESSLRLTHCPRCEYDLTGLPVVGICPECGRAYDQKMIVLFGEARGRQVNLGNQPTGQHLWTLPLVMLAIIYPAYQAYSRGLFAGQGLVFLALAGLMIASSGSMLLRRYVEGRGRVQLRITPAGALQLNHGENPSFLAVVPILCLVAAGGVFILLDQEPIFAIAFMSVGVLQLFALRRRHRFVPWTNFTHFDLTLEKGGIYRVKSNGFKRCGSIKIIRQEAIDFAAELSTAQYDELRKKVERWRAEAAMPEYLASRQAL